MIPERISDPAEIPVSRIDQLIAERGGAVIQFSRTPPDLGLLRLIDTLCQRHGDALEVRFYGNYSREIDDVLARSLPNVRNLSVDCLIQAESLNGLFGLTKLTRLSLGVFELKDKRILTKIGIGGLRELSIGETRSTRIDLSPLRQCKDLEVLRIEAQPEGMETVRELPKLRDLTLRQIGKAHSLGFASEIPRLKRLTVILGGRANINEVSHSGLEQLEVIWVRGFSDLGNLSRFPSLRILRVEDQLQLREIDLGNAPASLRKLAILNCKNLGSVGLLSNLTSLETVRIGRTAIPFEEFASMLPKSVREVRFWESSTRRNAEITQKLECLGYPQK